MNAVERHALIQRLADECAILRDNGRACIAVELLGKVVRFHFNDGRKVRRTLPDSFFAEIEQPRY